MLFFSQVHVLYIRWFDTCNIVNCLPLGIFFFSGVSLFEKSYYCRQDKISSFIKWFNDNGGKAEQVVIDDFGEQGLGLKAVSDIKVTTHNCIAVNYQSKSEFFFHFPTDTAPQLL